MAKVRVPKAHRPPGLVFAERGIYGKYAFKATAYRFPKAGEFYWSYWGGYVVQASHTGQTPRVILKRLNEDGESF